MDEPRWTEGMVEDRERKKKGIEMKATREEGGKDYETIYLNFNGIRGFR